MDRVARYFETDTNVTDGKLKLFGCHLCVLDTLGATNLSGAGRWLSIGAVTPQEIAVSILAELMAVKYGKIGDDANADDKAGTPLRWAPREIATATVSADEKTRCIHATARRASTYDPRRRYRHDNAILIFEQPGAEICDPAS